MRWKQSLAACASGTVAFAALAAATPVVGQNDPVTITAPKAAEEEVPTRRVSYRDLNLASMEGERILVRRVKVAVREVCPFNSGSGRIDRECRDFAWNGAKPQIDRAVLRARQIAATGTSNIAPVAIAIMVPQR